LLLLPISKLIIKRNSTKIDDIEAAEEMMSDQLNIVASGE